jgi:type I restriction enzyme S subunit
MKRGKWLFQKMDRPVRAEDEVVTCFRDGVVTLRKNRRLRGFTESLKEIGYQGIRKGDLVIHAMDAFAGAIGVSNSDGKGTPVYSVCEPRQGVNPHYYAYALREMSRSLWILALAKGIRERSTDFRFEAFGVQVFPILPEAEQDAIVHFLDHADRRIRRAIRAKRKLIALLNEQKQIQVHSLLSKGNPSNDSSVTTGNPWFPEIPFGWSLLPLRRLIFQAIDGPHYSPRYQDAGIPFISARNIKPDKWALGDAKYISEEDYREFSKRVIPTPSDVLYTKGGTTGIARVVDLDFPFQVWVHVAVLKIKTKKVDPHYLALALNSPKCYEQSQLYTKGATNQDLGLGRMKDIVLPVPPRALQEILVVELQRGLADARESIEAIEREISLLLELRTRLISDVVTGKLDVREAATQFPAEDLTAESIDDSEAILEDEEAPEDAESEEVEA